MNLALNDIQLITMKDILITGYGLSERQVEDMILLLSFKRDRVQLAFYHRLQGMTFDKVAEIIGVDRSVVNRYFFGPLTDVKQYLVSQIDTNQ